MCNRKMSVAEAIETVLLGKSDKTMHAYDIACEIEKRGLYIQKNGKYPVYNHIRARACQRKDMFECLKGNYIRLK